MDAKANERTLYKAQAIIRAYARALEAEEQDGMYESVADEFAATAEMILGGSASKDFYDLAESLDKIRSEVWFRNQQAEITRQAQFQKK